MSDNEYVVLGLKRFIATLFFKYTRPGTSTTEAIQAADRLIKDLND